MSVDVFLLHIFYIIFGVGLPTYFSNHSPFPREHIFLGFTGFLLSRVGALSFITTGHRAYSSTKSRSKIGFYVCAVLCVHKHRTFGFNSHPRRLGYVQKSLTQRHCSRINAGSWNKTSAPVQALDHKSNSLHLGYCT